MIPTEIESKRKLIFTVANGITLLRIVGTVILLILTPVSPLFMIVYTLTGVTDVLDGWLARRTGTASEFGARLDSIADLLFYAILLIKLIPFLWIALPRSVWYATVAILLIRIVSYLTAAIKYRCFASLHTYLNKLTGIAVFLLPYAFLISAGEAYSRIICVTAFLASFEELAIHISSKRYNPDIKSIFQQE